MPKPLGKFKGGAYLAIRLERVHTNWGSYPVSTSSIDRVEKGKGKRTALIAGGGGAFGALVGGLPAVARVRHRRTCWRRRRNGGQRIHRQQADFLPAETLLTFHLEHSVHITEQK